METYQMKKEGPGLVHFAQRLWQVVLSRPAVVLAVMTAILCFVGNHLLVITDPVESNYALTA
ncbi:MAG: glycosyltransferase family 39 protein, partial [Megasphaera sp.]|nr:glycosyltransferase family 39 protein [Megasphaera sp.]